MASRFQIAMDDEKLRQLERQYKLRVKTGCGTCRTRRVKCDETKPECNRCTKTGRKCDGYKTKVGSPSASASYRNPSFLVLPLGQAPPTSVPRSPPQTLSLDAMENRSFYYFQSHTLPKWTEFFDSELWSQKVLQLSHSEPAIKHGILALSSMHEKFETTLANSKTDNFAFEQYMEAVKHSNNLISGHEQHGRDVEKVLIACIIFTCYENLAGNYRAANMHLGSGLRILAQHRRNLAAKVQTTAALEPIADVLYRFDLQAMTFSDNASPYDYGFDHPPSCPSIPPLYTKNSHARNDLVGLLRCMMWVSGVANINPQAAENSTWLKLYTELIGALNSWDRTFELYQKNVPRHEQGDPKIYAGNTLLKMYSIFARTTVAAGAGGRSEMTWDAFVDSFKTIIDLAETLPILTQPVSSPPASQTPLRTPTPTPTVPSSSSWSYREIAPNPATATPSPPPGTSTLVFSASPSISPSPSDPKPEPRSSPTTSPTPHPKSRPTSFSPSFELSPIVPLFVTACRCRDPIIRRRAVALLLNCRRREGVWDSYGAGLVALQYVKLEEGMDQAVDLGRMNWLPLKEGCGECGDVEEMGRVRDVFKIPSLCLGSFT
ncbi:hypothetical protein CC80DRAFT_590776 [Byssothecium circinans]|uniref:Zn(2)-C6 fungal-type domain-containing protein n=1 Tax=Byssothecium circinans TaxID=147558 RepID=A0A6A5U5H1_9PLEO|nr:hypothetical protein CC80DRAFT_590776 [Byssothecium circinans]